MSRNTADVAYAMGGWLEDYSRFMRRRKAVRKQRTFCFCPVCKNDLCSNNSFDSDTDLVRYTCTVCGTESEWMFDAPVPIIIRWRLPEALSSNDGLEVDKSTAAKPKSEGEKK